MATLKVTMMKTALKGVIGDNCLERNCTVCKCIGNSTFRRNSFL
jgi:hypothetical protein